MKRRWLGYTSLLGVILFTGLKSPTTILEDEFIAYDELIPGSELTIMMTPVTGGKYMAGSPAAEAGRSPDEGPQHEVSVGDFWMSTMEITWDQYEIFLYRESDGAEHPDKGDYSLAVDGVSSATMPYVNFNLPGHPVTNVTQYAASTFCEWLTAKTGRFYRLPTEAEWEYAARSGGKQHRWSGTDVREELPQYAWFDNNHLGIFDAIPAGSKKPNDLGLYDMSGNVREWVGAYYQFYPEPETEPAFTDMEQSGIRILRGGSYDGAAHYMQTYWRMGTLKDVRTELIGFRCARSIE